MAKAGDGAKRSEIRRKSDVIQVRVAPEQRTWIEAEARRRGFPSAAGFLREGAFRSGPPAAHQAARFAGCLGQVGGWLTEAAEGLADAGRVAEANTFRDYSKRIVRMQRDLIEDELNACKSDP